MRELRPSKREVANGKGTVTGDLEVENCSLIYTWNLPFYKVAGPMRLE